MLNFFYRARNKKGFTLIELIVVIAILGILALIAIPRFAGVRGTANQGVAISNVTNIQRAAEMAAATANTTLALVTDGQIETALGQTFADLAGNPPGASYGFDQANGVATVSGITTPGDIDGDGDTDAAFDYGDIVSN